MEVAQRIIGCQDAKGCLNHIHYASVDLLLLLRGCFYFHKQFVFPHSTVAWPLLGAGDEQL